MSSIGKIFVVVNLLLAALLVGWAVRAQSENSTWKQKHDELKADLTTKHETVTRELSSVRAEKGQADQTIATLRAEVDGKDADLRRTKEELSTTQGNLNKWAADLNNLASSHQSVVASNEKLQAEKDKAIKAQFDAEKARDEALTAQQAAEKDLGDTKTTLANADSKIADLEKDLTALGKSKKKVENDLASLQQYTGASLENIHSMPKIDGRVSAVTLSVEPGLVQINKGNTDGVKRGFTFEIYDGTKYKGKARVEFVHDTTCSAILINAVKGETIRQGDIASTQL